MQREDVHMKGKSDLKYELAKTITISKPKSKSGQVGKIP